ncbi:hypothetical protein FOWG_03627 [Fusarium oxysporum f. sp. lycopersici MN25]|nr:hypothetical protein FOWG_03627 [Fusarium oxysporum f. sp. lycopersici MN25]
MVGQEDVEKEGAWMGRLADVLAQGERIEAVSFPSRPQGAWAVRHQAFAAVEDGEARGNCMAPEETG